MLGIKIILWKRGVTFIKEIVPKPALTFVANAFYGEKYVTFPTRHQWEEHANSMRILYEWKHQGAWDSIEVNAALTPSSILPNSEEEFITEHYLGYTKINNRLTSEYQVEHPRWTTYHVLNHKIKVRFSELYGKEFAQLQDTIPDSIMLAEGSSIAVMDASKIQ